MSVCKITPGWNAPQGVENVHTLCAGKPESDDRGNNISVNSIQFNYIQLHSIQFNYIQFKVYSTLFMKKIKTYTYRME